MKIKKSTLAQIEFSIDTALVRLKDNSKVESLAKKELQRAKNILHNFKNKD